MIFQLDRQRYALQLAAGDRIVRAVEDDGLVSSHDLDKFLSPLQTCTLDQAMDAAD